MDKEIVSKFTRLGLKGGKFQQVFGSTKELTPWEEKYSCFPQPASIEIKARSIKIVFDDGSTSISKCGPKDKWNLEKGIYVAIANRYTDRRYIKKIVANQLYKQIHVEI